MRPLRRWLLISFSCLLAFPALGTGTSRAQSNPEAKQAFAEGQELVAAKKPGEAADKFQEVVDAEPTFATGWYALAAARRRAGQCDKAITAYRRYAELQPAETEPYYGLGLCLKEVGDHKGAAEALTKYVALEKRPSAQRWVEHARSVLADIPLETPPAPAPSRAASDTPPDKEKRPTSSTSGAGAQAYTDAQHLRDSGHIEEAIARFRQAIAAEPTHLAARAALGELFLKIRRDDEAIAVFRSTVDRSASYSLAWYDLAFALRVRGRMTEAVDAYQHYIKLKPTDPDPYFGLGRALQKLGKNEAAVRAYQTYVSLEKRPSEERWVRAAQAELRALGAGQPR